MKVPDRLTEAIAEKLEASGEWILSRDEVLELADKDIRDVYVLINGSTDPLVSFNTTEYSSQEPGVLVSFLECLGFADASTEFWKAGIWIPYFIQIELQQELLNEIIAGRKSHKLSFDTFLAIFDHYDDYISSLQVYVDEFFPAEEFINSTAERVLRIHSETNPAPALIILKALARELLRREIVPLWNILLPLFSELRDFLIKMKRVAEPLSEIKRRPDKLGALFGFQAGEIVEKRELQKRYKEKMKKYHPDINPGGLEFSKELNLAYAALLSNITQS